MIEILLAAVFSLSATAIFYDATRNRIGKIPGESGLFNLPAGGWAVAALLLWIVTVPAYLFKRASLLRKAAEHPVETGRIYFKLALLALASVVMFFFNLAALMPDAGPSEVVTAKAPTPLTAERVVEAPTPAPAPVPAAPTLGLSKNQILAGLDDFLPPLESAPLSDSKDRLMGKTDTEKAATLVELIGQDAEQPYRVSLMMFMPNDAPAILIGNMTVYGTVTKNVFPGWDGGERLDWLNRSIKKLMKAKTDANTPSVEKAIDDKIIRVSLFKSLGAVSVTIQHKNAPE